MSAYGIAASYWVLAMALGVLGLLFIFVAMDGFAKGKGDPPSVVMGTFFSIIGLFLLYYSVNGFVEFSIGHTKSLDFLVKMWIQAATLTHKFWHMLKLAF